MKRKREAKTGSWFNSASLLKLCDWAGDRFRVKRLQPGSATSPLGWPYYRITVCFQDLNCVFPDSRKLMLRRNQVASTVEKCPATLSIVEVLLKFFRSQHQAISRFIGRTFWFSTCFFKRSCTRFIESVKSSSPIIS